MINCRNGELWFDDDGSVAFFDHDPEHRLTSMVATDYIEGADCPRFKAALRRDCSSPDGKHSTWLALDSEPRQFPEGCSELIAVNRAFGFDASAAQRLIEAMVLVDRRRVAIA